MKYDHIMIRFGELSTKGKNKKDFIARLDLNVRKALSDFPSLTFERRYDHIYIALHGSDGAPVIERLKDVSGIYAMSLVHKCVSELDEIVRSSFELIKQEEGKTFKVTCKRSNKKFPIVSDEIIRKVAPLILKNTDLKVDVHNPDILLSIEVRDEATYIFTKTFLGSGGLPLGMAGKAMMMLSGGIDSPVASYLLLRRGITLECIHFASPPYTQTGVIYKLVDILTKLNRYQEPIKLHIMHFTKIQEAIYANVDESYAITIMRRMMLRLAERLAKYKKCLCLATGESIGQVASQTLHSLKVINSVTNLPIIRPCAVLDKSEIIKIAKKIETYDISIRPFEDCCTIFTPKNPKTMPHFDEVEKMERNFEWESLLDEAINNIETVIIPKKEILF
ncbi:MAG: tRNA uracil 4-sulfurtransferase ThiI [Bacilli bacterium]